MFDTVSVVIPTSGRRSVVAAATSATAQESLAVEVLVVVNGGRTAHEEVAAMLPDDPRIRILHDDSGGNANSARQLGIEQASHETVALLDDDDLWKPRKLLNQRRLLERLQPAGWWVAACGIDMVRQNTPLLRAPITFPEDFHRADVYLFRRRGLRDRRPTLQTSTLLFRRDLALQVPFDAEVARHQDWDWLLRCQEVKQAQFLVSPSYDVVYNINTQGSLTGSTPLSESVEFARRHLSDRGVRGDFLLTRPFDMAVARHDMGGALHLLRLALRSSRPGLVVQIRAAVKLVRLFAMRTRRRRASSTDQERAS